MRPIRRKKLYFLATLLVTIGVVIGLVMYALRQNISLYYAPSDLWQHHTAINQMIRVGGLVMPHSIHRNKHDLTVYFAITDNRSSILVKYKGILPDLFREGQGIIVSGYWQGKQPLMASQVLAKHDEKYMPREVTLYHQGKTIR